MRWGRAASVAAGLVVHRFVPEVDDRVHPVALFGRLMNGLEGRWWRDDIGAGVRYAAAGVTVPAALGAFIPSLAAGTATVVAGHQLRAAASAIVGHVEAGDLDAARAALPALVGRDPSDLDAADITAAVIESVAENMVDAVVAPAFWAVVAGGAGALAYRATNTMDAMVGHRSDRYERFGKASARLDDVANWIPARVTAALFAAAAPGRAESLIRATARDASAHPSPNAGIAEAAMAGALGVRLGGPLRYGQRAEVRPWLGDGDRPDAAAARRAIAIANRAELILVGLLVLAALIGGRR